MYKDRELLCALNRGGCVDMRLTLLTDSFEIHKLEQWRFIFENEFCVGVIRGTVKYMRIFDDIMDEEEGIFFYREGGKDLEEKEVERIKTISYGSRITGEIRRSRYEDNWELIGYIKG